MTSPRSAEQLRELDARVAVEVMGYEWRVSDASGNRCLYAPGAAPSWMSRKATGDEPIVHDWDVGQFVPHYSRDWSAAGLVVEHIREKFGYAFTLSDRGAYGWAAQFAYPGYSGYMGDTAPLAISLAALSIVAAPSENER